MLHTLKAWSLPVLGFALFCLVAVLEMFLLGGMF